MVFVNNNESTVRPHSSDAEDHDSTTNDDDNQETKKSKHTYYTYLTWVIFEMGIYSELITYKYDVSLSYLYEIIKIFSVLRRLGPETLSSVAAVCRICMRFCDESKSFRWNCGNGKQYPRSIGKGQCIYTLLWYRPNFNR